MGREVKDTYRWMEDIRSPETLNWLKTQDTLRDNYKGEIEISNRTPQALFYHIW
ncbi:MAG: hypothetical protein IPL22_19240 [Bacteroidetes bacterium]|nr:hypothetical protein [Bacteroidota bacterium]